MLTHTGNPANPGPRDLGHRGPGVIPHVHWFRWAGHEPFGNGSRYACRCGVVRSAI